MRNMQALPLVVVVLAGLACAHSHEYAVCGTCAAARERESGDTKLSVEVEQAGAVLQPGNRQTFFIRVTNLGPVPVRFSNASITSYSFELENGGLIAGGGRSASWCDDTSGVNQLLAPGSSGTLSGAFVPEEDEERTSLDVPLSLADSEEGPATFRFDLRIELLGPDNRCTGSFARQHVEAPVVLKPRL